MTPYRDPAPREPEPAPPRARRPRRWSLVLPSVLAFLYSLAIAWLRSHGLL